MKVKMVFSTLALSILIVKGWPEEPFIVIGTTSPEEDLQAQGLLSLVNQPASLKQQAKPNGFHVVEKANVIYLIPLHLVQENGFSVVRRLLAAFAQHPPDQPQDFTSLNPEIQSLIRQWLQQAPMHEKTRARFLNRNDIQVMLESKCVVKVQMEGQPYTVSTAKPIPPRSVLQPNMPNDFQTKPLPAAKKEQIEPPAYSPPQHERYPHGLPQYNLYFSRQLSEENLLAHAQAFYSWVLKMLQDEKKHLDQELKNAIQKCREQSWGDLPEGGTSRVEQLEPTLQQILYSNLLAMAPENPALQPLDMLQQRLQGAQIEVVGYKLFFTVGVEEEVSGDDKRPRGSQWIGYDIDTIVKNFKP